MTRSAIIGSGRLLPMTGARVGQMGTIEGPWSLILEDGHINEVRSRGLRAGDPEIVTDVGHALCTPGLVDPHTHLIYAGDRSDEVAARSRGERYTGGGILRNPLLEASGRGVFNAHMGILPRYRGTDVVEWPLVEERTEDIGLGVTVHFMATGLDTGPIANFQAVRVETGDSMERLRKRFEPAMLRGVMQALRDLRDDRLELEPQRIEDGRQYFVMHPRFYAIARRKLAALAAQDSTGA